MDEMSGYLIDVWVPHEPEQVGSKNAFVLYKNRATKEPVRRPDGSIVVNVTDENPKVKAFQKAVRHHVGAAYNEVATPALLVAGHGERAAFELLVDFYLYRPMSHYGTGRNAHLVKDAAPARPITYPDEDKLLRSVQDGMAELLWRNDSQVVRAVAEKWYAVPDEDGDGLGVRIRARIIPEQTASDLPLEQRRRVIHAEPAAVDDDGQGQLLAV